MTITLVLKLQLLTKNITTLVSFSKSRLKLCTNMQKLQQEKV